jgi:hypothetical protein
VTQSLPDCNYDRSQIENHQSNYCYKVPYLGIGLTVSMHAAVLGTSAATIIGVIALVLNGVRSPVTSLVTFARRERLDEERARSERQQEVRIAAANKRKVLPPLEIRSLN